MKYYIAFFILLCLPAHAAERPAIPESTLFFSDDKAQEIEMLAREIVAPQARSAGIHLGAILYFAPNNWTLWLQGEKRLPGSENAGIRIVSVEPNLAHIQWKNAQNAAPQDIKLRPHQTFVMATGEIIEGGR